MRPATAHCREPLSREVRVDALHRLILDVVGSSSDLAETALQHVARHPSTALQPSDWDRMEMDFAGAFSVDAPPPHAIRESRRLVEQLRLAPCPATWGALARRVEQHYRDAAVAFAPLLIHFVQEALRTCQRHKVSRIIFLARDAIPLHVIGLELCRRIPGLPPLSLLNLNRSMLPGFPSPAITDSAWVQTYLAEAIGATERVALVDTGLYGTLVHGMMEMGVVVTPVTLFFASKNPHIHGYLNGLTPQGRPPFATLDPLAETCCDSLETWPKLYGPCVLHGDAHGVHAWTRMADPISVVASLALYRALAQQARAIDLEALDPHEALQRLDLQRLEPSATLMLPMPLPRWAHADAWQDAWRAGPLPPLG